MPPPNTAVQLAYQICPIILTGGAASQIPGGMLPIFSLFSGVGVSGLGLPFNISDLDDAFGAFNVLPGGTLVSQQIAKYPFANQSVAANATIREPLTLSVIMDAPMRGPNAWAIKQMIMTALKFTLDYHNNSGGTYTVLTPAYMYDNLIMTALTDNSRGNNSLPQNAWRFDFERPLVALSDLAGAQNQLMSKISAQVPTTGAVGVAGISQTGIQVGAATGQSALQFDANTGLWGSVTTTPPSSLGTAQSYLNFPASANPANFPFTNNS
jgi:hypothetical protein